MTTLTAEEKIDGERIWKTRELPKGAKVQVHYKRQEMGKEPVEWDCVAVFEYVDGYYGKWHDEETGEILIFNGLFTQIDQDCFALIDPNELWNEEH